MISYLQKVGSEAGTGTKPHVSLNSKSQSRELENKLMACVFLCFVLLTGCAKDRQLSHLGPFRVGEHVRSTCDFYVPSGHGSSGNELVTPENMTLDNLRKHATNITLIPRGTLFEIQSIRKHFFKVEGSYTHSFQVIFYTLDGEQRGKTFDASGVFMKWQPNSAIPGGFHVFIEKEAKK